MFKKLRLKSLSKKYRKYMDYMASDKVDREMLRGRFSPETEKIIFKLEKVINKIHKLIGDTDDTGRINDILQN